VKQQLLVDARRGRDSLDSTTREPCRAKLGLGGQ
jgi:hypothetical protein